MPASPPRKASSVKKTLQRLWRTEALIHGRWECEVWQLLRKTVWRVLKGETGQEDTQGKTHTTKSLVTDLEDRNQKISLSLPKMETEIMETKK